MGLMVCPWCVRLVVINFTGYRHRLRTDFFLVFFIFELVYGVTVDEVKGVFLTHKVS